MRLFRNCFSTLAFFCLIAAAAIFASSAHARLYKWVDETGTVRYSDQVPPDQAKQGRKLISSQGFVAGEVARAKSPEEIKREREMIARQKREELISRTQKESDRKLLTSYPKLESIDRAIKQKQDNIQSAIKLTEARIEKLKNQVVQLEQKAAQQERISGELPTSLYEQIDERAQEVVTQRQVVINKNREYEETTVQMQADRRRYIELVGEEDLSD